jgi:hypothetical protein
VKGTFKHGSYTIFSYAPFLPTFGAFKEASFFYFLSFGAHKRDSGQRFLKCFIIAWWNILSNHIKIYQKIKI